MQLRSCKYCDRDIQFVPNGKEGWVAKDVDGTDHKRTCERTCVREPYQVPTALPKQQKRKHVFKWGKVLAEGRTEYLWRWSEGKWVQTTEAVRKRY